MAAGEKRAGVATFEGLEPGASVVAGTVVVLVITPWIVIVVAGRASTFKAWPARKSVGKIALVYIVFEYMVCVVCRKLRQRPGGLATIYIHALYARNSHVTFEESKKQRARDDGVLCAPHILLICFVRIVIVE